jgi:hypothetical protein
MSFPPEISTTDIIDPEPRYTFNPQGVVTTEEKLEIIDLLINSGVNIEIPFKFQAQVEGLSKGAKRHISRFGQPLIS